MLINPKDTKTLPLNTINSNDFLQKVKLKDKVKRMFLILISQRVRPLPKIKINLKEVKNVLFLRNDGLGDYVLTTPLIRLMKEMNPGCNIDIVASHRNAKLIEYDTNIRKVFKTSHKPNFIDLITLAFRIKKYSDYDLMITSKHTKITNTTIMFNLISKKAIKIGFKIASFTNEYNFNSYKLTFHNIYNGKDKKYYKMLQWMLQAVSNEELTFRNYYLLNEKFTEENSKNQFNYKYSKILINISGFEKPRIFTEDTIVQIKNSVKSIDNNISTVFTSSPESYPILDSLLEKGALTHEEIGKYDIISLIHELPKFDLIITPDTAITHFASALKIKQIIFYDTIEKYNEWSPEDDNYVALVGKGNINQIPINEFTKAFSLLMNSSRNFNQQQIS